MKVNFVKEERKVPKHIQLRLDTPRFIDSVKKNDFSTFTELIDVVDDKARNLALIEVDFESQFNMAKLLLDKGAEFVVSQPGIQVYVELKGITSAFKYLMNRIDKT